MAKRKPPSQRPELKMDETALALARQREEAKLAKTPKTTRLMSDELKSQISRNATSYRKAIGVAPSSSTKRQKKG
jgi:hypothetical protein